MVFSRVMAGAGSVEPLVTETLSIQTNGIRLHAEAAGPHDGPLVVLLHGFPEFWWGWKNQIGPLAKSGLRVIAPDQRGYNLSDKPKEVGAYAIDTLARDVLGIFDAFGREKAAVIGHDWGAIVAWHLAYTYPERVERLAALNGPHPAAMNRALRRLLVSQLLKSWYIGFFQLPRLPEWSLRFLNYRALRRAFLSSSRQGAFRKEDMTRYREAWSRPGALRSGIHWYRAITRQTLKKGIRAAHAQFDQRVRVPTLVLWGDRDIALEPVLADWSMDWVDNGRVVHFPEATHWLQHEESVRVNHRLIDFLLESGF